MYVILIIVIPLFCSDYRYQTLSNDQQYRAEVGSLLGENNVAKIPLRNNQNEELTLEISFIGNMKARLKVVSNNHNRYELVDVLDSEPKPVE